MLFIVEQWYDAYEFMGIFGVFSSQELAEAAIPPNENDDGYIFEIKVYWLDEAGINSHNIIM